jgi:hypothetical protein
MPPSQPQGRPYVPNVSRPYGPVVQRAPREQAPVGRVDSGARERSQPRYEQPRSSGSQPARSTPRYLPPDNGGRSAAPSRDSTGSGNSGSTQGRGTGEGTGTDGGSAWRPDTGGAYEFERRAPRTPVPTLVGTPRVRGPVAGTPRPGLSSRTGRTPDLSSTPRTTASPGGEGLVRLPRTEITRESILQRYRGRETADTVLPHRAPTDNDLSRARGAALRTSGTTTNNDERARAARTRATTVAPRGSVEAARRERESIDRLDRLNRDAPWRAKTIVDAGAAVSIATNCGTQIAIGVGVGFACGTSACWFWEPSCSPWSCAPFSHWACTFGWPWSCYGFGWPCYWGCWGWNSCSYYPYSYYPSYCSSYYPYSYSSWSPAPVYYTTVVNDAVDYGSSAAYEEPAAAGEGYITAAPAGTRAAGEQPPEVKEALIRGAADYLTLGDDAFRQGRYSDAVHHYARTVEYAPDDGVLYLLLSDALFATGDYHYAAFALRRAVELEPKILDNVIDKHGFYGDPLEYDKQISLAEQYLNEHFLDEDARLILAANYLFAKRPSQCLDLLDSPFSQAVLESSSGRRIHERAEALRQSAAAPVDAK